MDEVIGLHDEVAPLRPLIELAKHCGWWIPFKHVCLLSQRHSQLHLDDNGRLHNLNDMAVKYPDGWGVCAVHGVTVPERVVLRPDTLQIEDIDTEANTEVARVMLAQYERVHGQGAYLRDSNMRQIAHDDRWGTLYKKDMGIWPDMHVLQVTNSTPEPDGSCNVYYLAVPNTIGTALDAAAWLADVPPKIYQQLQQET